MTDQTPGEAHRQRWNERYRQPAALPPPSGVLRDYQHLLPTQGMALDLACGLGGNACFLAERGLVTHAWDLADQAIVALTQHTREYQLSVLPQVRDVVAQPPEPASFQVIVVSRFLERGLAPALSAALCPGGLLFYETFTRQRVQPGGPDNPDYLLAENELLRLFPGLIVRAYREDGMTGDAEQGLRNLAQLVVQKTALP